MEKKQRIDLHKNFEAVQKCLIVQILFFERIMRRELGGGVRRECGTYLGADYENLVREDGSLENEAELLLFRHI